MWHWWYNGKEQPITGVPPTELTGPETTITWRHLLRESKDPGDQQPDAEVASSRWMSAGRPMAREY